jgi:hypothetical protein
MQKLLAYLIIPIILLGLFAYIANFLYTMNKDELTKDEISDDNFFLNDTQNEIFEDKLEWVKKISVKNFSEDFLPVVNTYIELNLDIRIEYDKLYNLKIKKLDTYQFFCLKQILLEYRASYQIQKNGKENLVLIYVENKNYVQEIVEALKKYDIESKITHIVRRNNVKI